METIKLSCVQTMETSDPPMEMETSDPPMEMPDPVVEATTEAPMETPMETPAEPAPSGGSGCSAEAMEVIRLLNEYRAENGLPSIPASKSLCTVADTHVSQSQAMGDPQDGCNMHSWQDCCYTSDHANMGCMQDKPKELTCYQAPGFENSAWTSGTMTPQDAIDMWKGSPGHNRVMINQGTWSDMEWKAVGAAVGQNYAHLWFGAEPDCA
ncbi:MAG: CAP domain-containing protein [Akkermansiaceae bacterium]|nr:CAP domain-containing protein [Akkermansiaceae bacterium]